MGKMRQNIVIEPEVMNADQVCEYLGGNFGRNVVMELMSKNVIPTIQSGGRGLLLTRKKDVDEFIDYMFRKPINNKIIDTIPLKIIKDFGKSA